jgi:tRNA-splicing ligase RtcB
MIGSVGGGNHFAEVQYVASVSDARAAYAWGLRPGRVVTMVHSGSLALGHAANRIAADLTRSLWPDGLAHPVNGLWPLPLDEAPRGRSNAPARDRWLAAFAGAANFALGNRLFLSLMLREGLRVTGREPGARLVWDAPHNLLWPSERGALHRKGATPAGGYADAPSPYDIWGEPVIVPGSMGASSWVLRGLGNDRTLASAAHGAGRSIARGATGERPRGAGARRSWTRSCASSGS